MDGFFYKAQITYYFLFKNVRYFFKFNFEAQFNNFKNYYYFSLKLRNIIIYDILIKIRTRISPDAKNFSQIFDTIFGYKDLAKNMVKIG